jgi:uncharacterized protein YjeT (DUF2065 family)
MVLNLIPRTWKLNLNQNSEVQVEALRFTGLALNIVTTVSVLAT